MASATSPLGSESAAGDGPVLSLMSRRLRALRKKYNRILQMEAGLAQGKSINKEQEEVLRSKPGVVALIDEYEKLRSPLAAAVQEELARVAFCSSEGKPRPMTETAGGSSSQVDSAVEDLIMLLYFGCLFDVKPQSDFTSMILSRTHERECCLIYDYVTDEATELLRAKDLDMISALGGLVTSRPPYSGISHSNALQRCLHHSKLWLQEAHEQIFEGSSVTYASLRDKLNKIMASDYFTTTPEMKAPVDVSTAVGMHNTSETSGESLPDVPNDSLPIHLPQQEVEQDIAEKDIQFAEVTSEQSAGVQEIMEDEADAVDELDPTPQNEPLLPEANAKEHNQRDYKRTDLQYIPRRPYQNLRGGRGGFSNGGSRGYPNSRGHNGRGAGFENGCSNQYYDYGHPRNHYNARGRVISRGRGCIMYSHDEASSHGS